MSNRVLNLIYEGIYRPCARTEMLLMYLAALLVGFGFSLSELYFVIDFSRLEPIEALPMIVIGQGVGCFIALPAYMYLSQRLRPTVFLSLMFVSGVLTLIFCAACMKLGFTAWTVGFVFVPVSSAYWTMFHLSMIANMSDDNKGNEISVSMTALAVGIFSGFLIGGVLTDHEIARYTVAIASVSLLFVGFCLQLFQFIQSKALDRLLAYPQDETLRQALFVNPKRSVLTFLQGAFDMTATTAFPVWMYLIGLSGVFIGIVQASTVAARLFLSPYVGHLVNVGKKREIIIGSALKCCGWFPWLLLKQTILIPVSIFLWSIGGHFFNVGISEQWYASRTVSGAIGRQYAIGSGRVFGASVSLLLLTFDPYLFLLFSFCVAITLLLAAIRIKDTL